VDLTIARAPRKRFPKPIELPIRSMMNTTTVAMSTGSNQAYCAGKSIVRLPSIFGIWLADGTTSGHASALRNVSVHSHRNLSPDT
jgi:hypothetical protein